MSLDLDRLHDLRQPFEDLEEAVVKLATVRPGELHDEAVDAIRYVVRLAKLGPVRNRHGVDVDLGDYLAPFAYKVRHALARHVLDEGSLWGAMRELPELVKDARERRRRIVEHTALDLESLEAEVCTRQLVIACGGGGGSGYGYQGAFTLFHRRGLQPELLAGTSIGALMSLFRARRRVFDGAPLVEAAQRLSWERVFRVLQTESHYGIPATLRLYLRAAIGSIFQTPDGQPLRFRDMEIPLLVVTTGVGIGAMKHDLGYYEHLLDDAISPTYKSRRSRLQLVRRVVEVMRELTGSPDALRMVVFGSDPATLDADVLDAAGFSSAIPGLIHYDVLRDDQRMKGLLDELYSAYGITRLTEGGIVNNLPARPAWEEVMRGRIGRRNPYVVALDCFAPRLTSPAYLPIMQLVRPNVETNLRYANFYHAMQRVLSPLNLVPALPDVTAAMKWTMDELDPRMPRLERMLAPIRPLGWS